MKKLSKKSLAIILSVLFVISATMVAYGDEVTTTEPITELTTVAPGDGITTDEAHKTLEQQRTELEKKMKENEKNLAKYEDEAKLCEDYINALDERIGYINEELTLLDNEINEAMRKMNELEPEIKELNDDLAKLQTEYDIAKKELDDLNAKFEDTYNTYCERLRAMYISGNNSILLALLSSNGLSEFYSRYEMIKAVSRSDAKLLSDVSKQIEEITTKQDGLDAKKEQLNKKKADLDAKQADYDNQVQTIESKQTEIANKKLILSEDRAESDSLLAEYTKKTSMYTEFRNEDQALIDSVNNEIDDLLSGLKDPTEITTATQSDRPTDISGTQGSTDSELYSKSNAVLNLTYPVPGHYGVSCDFGYYSNGKPHTGTDFPCPTGSKVVAAQKGIVVTVKRLDYSYGYYVMIYHGTDAKGRKIVTLYAHNSSILVSVGQSVKKGQTIAKSGSTGNSTGPHSHFELIINGSKINAKNYLSK